DQHAGALAPEEAILQGLLVERVLRHEQVEQTVAVVIDEHGARRMVEAQMPRTGIGGAEREGAVAVVQEDLARLRAHHVLVRAAAHVGVEVAVVVEVAEGVDRSGPPQLRVAARAGRHDPGALGDVLEGSLARVAQQPGLAHGASLALGAIVRGTARRRRVEIVGYTGTPTDHEIGPPVAVEVDSVQARPLDAGERPGGGGLLEGARPGHPSTSAVDADRRGTASSSASRSPGAGVGDGTVGAADDNEPEPEEATKTHVDPHGISARRSGSQALRADGRRRCGSAARPAAALLPLFGAFADAAPF